MNPRRGTRTELERRGDHRGVLAQAGGARQRSVRTRGAWGRTLLLCVLALGCGATNADAATATASGRGQLPPETLRGPAALLRQYATPPVGTPEQREAATRLLHVLRAAAAPWHDPGAAAKAGYRTRRPKRRPGDERVMRFHAEHRGFSNDRRFLDARRPEVLIYADVPRPPLVLVGVMFSMPSGRKGPTPGGAITRWHTHRVCAAGVRRGVAPRGDGSCPRGATSRQGSEMMHVWFTRDLRSAFAIHAPPHELCVAGALPAARCRHAHGEH